MAHPQPSALLDSTLHTLQRRDLEPATGAEVIKEWISVLRHTDGAESAAHTLQSLYDELSNPRPDAARTRDLLNDVAQQTEHLSRSLEIRHADSLTQLAGSLRSFALDLDRI